MTPARSVPRILAIGPTPPPYNGVSVIMDSMLRSSLCERFELVVLDTTDRRGLANMGRFDPLNVGLALLHGLRFLWLLVTKRPALVYVPISQNTLAYLRDCLFLAPSRLLRKRVVVHLHGSNFRRFYDESPGWMRWLIRWTLRDVRRAVVLAGCLKPVFQGLVPEERIVVVENAIADLNGGPLRETPRANDVKQVLYLANLLKTKGFLEVIRCVPLVLQRQPLTRFVLAGEHTYHQVMHEARELVDRHGLQGIVTMPGVVTGETKVEALRAADVFVFPPIAPEGQPLVVLEALAMGLPVIATPQGAIPDTITHGVDGFLVPPGDAGALADRIVALLEDDELRERMGSAARAKFEQRYTLDHMVDGLVRVFDDAMKGGPRG